MQDNTQAVPNVLFLMSDEHRADTAGFAGNQVVQTPVLDWLAETGVVFDNAYTPSPICVPARQSIMSGQLPRTCGVESFGEDLAPGSMTWARQLARHAYYTCCCGKLHHLGPDQMMGWNARPAGDVSIADWAIEDRDEQAFAARGTAQSRHKWNDAKEVFRAGVGDGPYQRNDSRAVQAAVDQIENWFCNPFYDRPGHPRPMCLKVSLVQPHYPYFTDRERFVSYLNRVKPFLDEPVFDHPFLSQRQVRVGEDVTERDMYRATAAYYGMVDRIDEHYGSVLDALRQVGQDLDDWIIIYTSDHGEMLGEHGIWEKQKFFEASVRVPLIVRFPKRFEPRRVSENVNLCDLFATICEMCGLPTPGGLDSRSLVPLMRGDSREWRSRYWNETVSQFGRTNLMIKRDALKYQRYDREDCRDQPEVLFDLERDPTERANFIGDARYAEALDVFRARACALGFGPGADRQSYVNAGYA